MTGVFDRSWPELHDEVIDTEGEQKCGECGCHWWPAEEGDDCPSCAEAERYGL